MKSIGRLDNNPGQKERAKLRDLLKNGDICCQTPGWKQITDAWILMGVVFSSIDL
jgi:hypothetical protein